MIRNSLLVLVFLLSVSILKAQTDMKPEDTEVWEPVPPKVTPGMYPGMPPSDAIVLFDGSNLSKWRNPQWPNEVGTIGELIERYQNLKTDGPFDDAGWKVEAGEMVVNLDNGAIETKESFGDIQLHIEWLSPENKVENSQMNGNSGIFLMGLYELQVLNSYDTKTYSNGQAGSIYKQKIPLVNASRKPSTWQYYDVVFHAPRFNADGSVKTAANITVFHNGVLIQDHVQLDGPTLYIGKTRYFKHPEKLPLRLQDHDDVNDVRYRNIWVRELN
ncbi:MAG: DUF1080 domain-containing protein [Cyclobacteriaceae bacterium]